MIYSRNFLVVADLYESLMPYGRKRLSALLFNSGKKLDGIAAGETLTLTTYERCMQWFTDHWPEGEGKPSQLLEFELQVARAQEIAATQYSGHDMKLSGEA